jgi:sigma-54 dependent transcriptional regulator, acetoin dehydrogenase operon transcriptional activator AcoR
LNRSWQRCLAQGHRPDQSVDFQPIYASEFELHRQTSHELRQAASPVIRSLARAMADTRYFALLTNAQGIVIDVNGPIDAQDPRARNIARLGVDLSEAVVGTTAIGAVLAEHEPVWLHQGEHFFASNAVYSCAGAPIFGPKGDCVGMLDLTGVDVPERPALKHLVAQSAQRISNALTMATAHRLLLRLNWPGQSLGNDGDGLAGVDADGFIVAANRTAMDMLALPPSWQQAHCSEVFAAPWQDLFDRAHLRNKQTEMPLWSGLRVQVMALDSGAPTPHSRPTSARLPLKDVETALIRQAVVNAGGNVMAAAQQLGISRATIYRKLAQRD